MASLRQSPGLRLLMVFVITIILLVPMTFVENLIHEREYRRSDVVQEISGKWGLSQTLKGPVLKVPYKLAVRSKEKTEDGTVERTRIRSATAHFLPQTLDIAGNLSAETRYRSIFETVVYTTGLVIKGEFGPLDFSELPQSDDIVEVQWSEATFCMGISDMRGIDSQIAVNWQGQDIDVEPGQDSETGIQSGIFASVTAPGNGKTAAFSVPLELRGSGSLMFTPAGRTTTVSLQGNWPGPSFVGEFLPDTRSVTDSDFSARWEILHLNRNYPQQWRGQNMALDGAHFGLDLLLPVSQYQEAIRTAKYALLFIVLTFSAVFLTEILTSRNLHPINYLLVGLALVVFYLLLLAVSEHTNFDAAYILAALATIICVGGYCRAVLRSSRWGALISGILLVLYGFYYILLQLEDYALLVGSLGIFAILALLMFLTRGIDWYSAFGKKEFCFDDPEAEGKRPLVRRKKS